MTTGNLSIESSLCQQVTWEIPDFLQLRNGDSYFLQSPEFLFGDSRYRLRLFPFGAYAYIGTDYVGIVVLNLSGSRNERDVSYELSCKSRAGKDIRLNLHPTSGLVFSIARRELQQQREMYVPDGTLTLICTMHLREPSGAKSHESEETETQDKEEKQEGLPGVAKLQSDYRQLLQKGAESDACFLLSGKEFRAHRCVLRARSAVFDAMFDHETAEKENGRVVIDDLDPESFGDFLEYLYTGAVGTGLSDDNAFGLYTAADKYDVPTLKSECGTHMRRTLSVDTFCDVMTVALRHHEEDLLQQAIQFFKQNMQRIILTPKWQQFVIDNGTSANELFIKALVPEGH